MSEEELQASTTVASCIGQPVGGSVGQPVGGIAGQLVESTAGQPIGTNIDSYLIIDSSIKK